MAVSAVMQKAMKLHVMQVIHMDLKSKNILLNRDQTVAKIADVGLSRGFNSASPDFVAGTREYSAPEVLLGRACTLKVGITPCIEMCFSQD